MAYRFKASETVPEGIRRIVLDEITSAAEVLGDTAGKKRDSAVHEARKSVKKIRGILRLVEPQLGSLYRAENRRLRDIGRQLSELRDAAAILEVFDQVAAQEASGLDPAALAAVRAGLERDKRETDEKLDAGRVLARARSALLRAAQRTEEWPLTKNGFAGIAPGLEKTYRRGRRALEKAEANPSPVRFHNLRKRAKDHWYHVRLLEDLWTELTKTREASLKDLETWLGDDHNIVVLRDKLKAHPERYGSKEQLAVFLDGAGRRQAKLRGEAIALGLRLYKQKPRAFVKSFSKLWDGWHAEPEKLNRAQKTNRRRPSKHSGSVAANKATSAA